MEMRKHSIVAAFLVAGFLSAAISGCTEEKKAQKDQNEPQTTQQGMSGQEGMSGMGGMSGMSGDQPATDEDKNH